MIFGNTNVNDVDINHNNHIDNDNHEQKISIAFI